MTRQELEHATHADADKLATAERELSDGELEAVVGGKSPPSGGTGPNRFPSASGGRRTVGGKFGGSFTVGG